MLFSMHRREGGQEESLGGRFGPAMVMGGRPTTDLPDFPEEAWLYFEKRLGESKNPILRSWYADALWEKKHHHLYARAAIQAHLDCYPIYVGNEWWGEAADALTRAIKLAARLNDPALIEEAKNKVLSALDYLSKRQSHPEVRYCLDLIDAIVNLERRSRPEDLQQALSVCQAGAAFYTSEQGGRDYYIARAFADREATLQTKLGHPDAAGTARVRIGEFWEAEADLKGKGSNLVSAALLQKAIQQYANIGRSDKVEELKVKVRESYQAANEQGEFGRISSEVKIPVTDIENQARELLKQGLVKALLSIGIAPAWIPDIEEARNRAQQLKQEFPLQGIIPHSTIRGTRQVNMAATQEEIDEANALNQYAVDAELRGVFLGHTFKILVEEGGLDSSSLVQHLARSPFIEPDVLDVIAVGVQRYFEQDYVSALHVLVPKLEETLRRTISKLGASTTSQGSDGFTREKPLDEVLKTPQLKDLLGKRVLFYYEYMLNHQLGENLRNDVAHGLMSRDRCTKNLTERVIHLYLILTPFEAWEVQSPNLR